MAIDHRRTPATLAALPANRRTPPAVVATEGVRSALGRTPIEALRGRQPLPPGSRLGRRSSAPQQPLHHQQLVHQVIEGPAGGLPVGIGDRFDQQRVGLAMLLRGYPPRSAILAPLAKLACAPTLIILGVIANDGVMANDLDDLDETERGPQPPQGRKLVIVDLRHPTIMPPSWPDIGRRRPATDQPPGSAAAGSTAAGCLQGRGHWKAGSAAGHATG